MKSVNEIEEHLPYFTGTEEWYRYSPLFPNVLLTEGAAYIADSCDAFWLMDVISSHIPSIKGDQFAIAKLVRTGSSAVFTLADDEPAGVLYAKQNIEYTDFPLDEIRFYVIKDSENWTILLPSEY